MYKFLDSRNQADFQDKLQRKMEESNIDALLMTTPENIFYGTGYLAGMAYKTRGVGSELAVVPKSGRAAVITSQFMERGVVEQTKGAVDVLSYPVWIFIEDYYDPNETGKDEQPDPLKPLRMAVDVIKSQKANPVVGIERGSMPHDVYVFFAEAFGEENLVDIKNFMTEVRTIKFQWEIDVMRYAAKITQKMMNITMQCTEPGMTEADLIKIWTTSAYELTGGHELLTVYHAHTPGPDFWLTHLPRERVLKDGDIVRLDGGINICGYSSDLGRVYAVGTHVSEKQQAIFDTLLAARDAGIAKFKPGNRFCDVFHAAMDVCKKGALPHFVRGHVGHTEGLSLGEEYPMLSPSNTMEFEPGMVICFETPYYSSEFGSYNLEDTLVITEDGCELFTETNRSLFVK